MYQVGFPQSTPSEFMEILSIRLRQPFSFFLIILVFLCVLCGKSSAQEFKIVQYGVEYAEVTCQLADKEPVRINLLRLDLTKVRLDVHHALDKAIGVERTSSIATRHGAVAAINAGFFRLDKSAFAGDATNWLHIDNETLSEAPFERIALFIINDPKRLGKDRSGLHIKKLFATYRVKIGKNELGIMGFNRERRNNEIVLFTPKFSATTLTNSDGLEVIVTGRKVVDIVDGTGNSAIPNNGFVLSASGTAREDLRKLVKVGRKVQRLSIFSGKLPADFKKDSIYDTSTLWALSEDIIAGVPQLIKDGKIAITWEQEKASKSFVETRHPRTAVAKLKDGKFLMMTVDGRQPGVSVGMNLNEIADYLLSLGAVDAMNLDGGGSTTMFLDGKVVNKPSDKEGERKVGDAILVTLRNRKR